MPTRPLGRAMRPTHSVSKTSLFSYQRWPLRGRPSHQPGSDNRRQLRLAGNVTNHFFWQERGWGAYVQIASRPRDGPLVISEACNFFT